MGISRINLKLNEKAALVIGLGVPSLVLIYYLFKRNPNELDEDDLINGNRTLKVRSTCLEVRIPSECVKRVIGPQGAVIKEIQRKTNTRINFKEKPEATAAGGGKSTESVLLIRGSAVNTQRAEIEIKRLVLDTPVTLTREYLIPEYACGRIIGRGGASVREISQLSSCKVLIDKRFDSSALIRDKSLMNIAGIPMNSAEFANTSHKVVTLCGSIEQIESAKDLILAKIKEENEIREKKRGKLQPFQYQQSSMDKASRRKCKSMERIALINDRSSPSAIPEPTQQHIQLPTTSTSSSRTPAVKPLDFEALLNENKRVDVFVTAFSSTLVFWIQIAANVDLVRKLADDMSNFYSSQASFFLDFFNKDELKDHDLVAVRRRDNGYTKWFRAEIKSTKVRLEGVDRPELIDVYYIDDGISDYVQLRDIRLLGSQFCELPMQAIECTTCEVRSKYANWSEEAIGFFENFIFEVEYPGGREIEYLGARDSEGRAIVRLFDKASQSSVSDLLIEKGFAERLLLAKSPSVPLDKISEANEPEQNQDEQNNDQNQVVQEQIQEQDGLNNNDDSNI